MIVSVIFVSLAVVICGGGWLFARALHLTASLASVLMLALWFVITLAFAMPLGWRAWLGDAVLTLLLVIALALNLRPPSNIPDRPASLDWALFGVVGLLFLIPAVVLPVPLDTDAQGFGYLALTAKLGGDLTTLAPLQPDIDYLYAPGFTVLVAYLSERLRTPLHSTQFAAGAFLALLLVMVLYDFGRSLGGVVRARAHVFAAVLGVGLFTAYMDSHYTSMLGLIFGGAFLTTVYGIITEQPRPAVPRWLLAAVYLAALVLAHPDTTIIIGLGFGAWVMLMPLAIPRPSRRVWLLLTFGVPLSALGLILPWLLSVLHLLGSDIASPFSRYPNYWRVVLGVPPETLYHGGFIVLVALVGAVIGLRQRRHEALLALGWLLLILDFSTFGVLEHLLPMLVAPIVRYDYPFSIAWHGPIIPYVLLGGLAFDVTWRWAAQSKPIRVGASLISPRRHKQMLYAILAIVALAIILGGVFNREILALSKSRVTFFGAFASHADVQAMTWLRHNTAPDAYILNFPGPQEGDWVPVIAERRAVYYRPQPFFQRGDDDPLADTPEQVAMRAFWQDPANPAHADLLRSAGVDYVIVPQVVGNPASFADHFRWRRPFTDLIEMESAVGDAPYLELLYAANGAQVFRIQPETPPT